MSKVTSWLEKRMLYLVAALSMIVLALLLQPLLLRFSPDHEFHPSTLLSIEFLRLFLVTLAVIAPFWPDLAEPVGAQAGARRRVLLIGLLLIVAVSARSVRLTSMYLDQHSMRAADVGTIARDFYEKDPDIFLPQVNWRADAPDYVESTFPLVPWLASLVYRVVGEQPWVGRALVMLFAALEIVAMFGLVSLYFGQVAGFMAALFLALSPLAIFFGRAFMDDTPSLALAVAGLWGVAVWAQRGSRRALILGLVGITFGMLVKVAALYIYFPLLIILWERWGRCLYRQRLAWAILGLPLIPTIAWYAWAHYLGVRYLSFGIWFHGGPASYEDINKWGTPALVLSWAFIDRITGRILHEILTPAGLVLVLLGLDIALHKRIPGRLMAMVWLGGVLLFVAVSGEGQYRHNYYQLPLGAALAPFVGLGLAALWQRRGVLRWVALGLLVLMAAFSAAKLPYYYDDWQYWIPPEVQYIQSLTASDDRVITVTLYGETNLMYYLHRPGWVVDYTNPAELLKVPRYIAYGAKLLVLQDLEWNQASVLANQPWLEGLELLQRADRYAIYRLP